MRCRIFVFAVVLAVIPIPAADCCGAAEGFDPASVTLEQVRERMDPEESPHPRLILTARDFEAVRRKIEVDPDAKAQIAGQDRGGIYGVRCVPALLHWLGPRNETPVEMGLHWNGISDNPVTMHRSAWGDPDALFVGLKKLQMTVIEPEGAEIRTWDVSKARNEWDSPNQGARIVGFVHEAGGREITDFAVTLSPGQQVIDVPERTSESPLEWSGPIQEESR